MTRPLCMCLIRECECLEAPPSDDTGLCEACERGKHRIEYS